MNYREKFSERLSVLRKSAGVSLAELGEEIGVTDEAIRLLEKGKRSPSFEVLCALAEYFDVTVDYLIGKSEFPDYSASEDKSSFPALPLRVKTLREKKGIDICQMAALIEESPRNYAGYETGEVLPRLRVICSIADYFDVSLDYLIGRSDNPTLF